MPVTGLFYIADPSPHLSSALTDRLLRLHHPTNQSHLSFEYRLFRETPDPTRSPRHDGQPPPPPAFMQELDLSYLRDSLLVLVGNEMVVVNKEFDTILRNKLNALWAQSQMIKAEGFTFEFDGWRVRIGALMLQNTNRGHFVEVEYDSADYLSVGAPVVREILKRFVPETLQLLGIPAEKGRFYGDPVVKVEGEERVFGITDTGRQYMEMLRLRAPRDDVMARRL